MRPSPTPAALAGLALLATLATLLAACTSATAGPAVPSVAASKPSVIPVIVSREQVKGPNRLVFSFVDAASNKPAATPDRSASVALIAPGETQPGTATPATFEWAIEGSRGVYVANVDFPASGPWKAVFVTEAPGKPQEAIGFSFDVVDKGTTVAVGEAAPAAKTPTAADVGGDLSRIATDPKPDPAFYELSIDDALAQHKPFVLVFATPAFCKSAQCGPTLDRVKADSKAAPAGVAFINVEPYQLQYTEGRLQPVLDANNQLQPVESVQKWGLTSEPWIFTVDGKGVIRGSFEGVVGDDELKAAIQQIAGT